MSYLMQPYDDGLKEILEYGTRRTNVRTGIGTLSVFGMTRRFKLNSDYFPIVSRRKMYPKSVFAELLWFLSGSTSNKDLKDLGCNFWTPWVDHEWEKENGFAEDVFGPVYGFQLRHFAGHYGNGKGGYQDSNKSTEPIDDHDPNSKEINMYGIGGFDQMSFVINRIKEDHSCRRTLWSLWDASCFESMRLPPCHMMAQILVDDDRKLTLIMYQRSADYYIGVPANIQFYSALAIMIAQQTDCVPYEFVHMTADSHIYDNQVDAVKRYLDTPIIDSPKLAINKADSIFDYKPDDFIVSDYNHGPSIPAPVAV